MCEDSIRRLEGIGDAFGLAEGWVYLAGALELEGEVEQARNYYSQAKEVFQEKEIHGFAIDAQAGLARCLLKLNRAEQARMHAQEMQDYLSLHGAQSLEFPLAAYLVCAEVFNAAGDSEKAGVALQEGFQELTTRAERISELTWRQNYLENVPENRALRQLYQQRFDAPA
jgi:ATP/maltotriose-dependent transcriptional regulator MalT